VPQVPGERVSMTGINENGQPPELPPGNKFIKYPVIGRLFKFLTWWLVFTGIYASSSVCPLCGRPGCPVGGVSAGVVGGVFALAMAKGQACFNHLTGLFSLIRFRLWNKLKP
jgi:hypothetical protein